jgi:hypothetical protein
MGDPAWSAARRIPAEGQFFVSTEQRENLDAILRQSAFPADSDVSEQRRLLRELISAQPLPTEVTVTAAAPDGVPTVEITVDGVEPRHVVLYFHAGVYVTRDGAPRLPGLFPDPRRSGRCAEQSRTAPVGASRSRRTRYPKRKAKRTLSWQPTGGGFRTRPGTSETVAGASRA